MKKQLMIFGITLVLSAVGLSGCLDSNPKPSGYTFDQTLTNTYFYMITYEIDSGASRPYWMPQREGLGNFRVYVSDSDATKGKVYHSPAGALPEWEYEKDITIKDRVPQIDGWSYDSNLTDSYTNETYPGGIIYKGPVWEEDTDINYVGYFKEGKILSLGLVGSDDNFLVWFSFTW